MTDTTNQEKPTDMIPEINGIPMHMTSPDDKWATMSFKDYHNKPRGGELKDWELEQVNKYLRKNKSL